MNTTKKLTIGLFGFGVVGEGVYQLIEKTKTMDATIKKICIKNNTKKRNAPQELFTTDKALLLNDPDINVIVEVINETQEAYSIVTTALKNGKHVVSASKKMIAENLLELITLQQENNLSFLYEASSCASIPIIRNLEEYYDNDLLYSIKAIVNGSTNYILTKMFEEQLNFKDALLQAQQLGFAETDPSFDVLGIDATNKWSILLYHAYGIYIHPNKLLQNGIQNISAFDAIVAQEKKYTIKLVAQALKLKTGGIASFVLPQFVTTDSQLAKVKNEYNGVILGSSFSEEQFFYGKGAGSHPTASAVLADIAALRYDYKYEYKKANSVVVNNPATDFYLQVYISFTEVAHIKKEALESIDEFFLEDGRKYIIGIIAAHKLIADNWWKINGNSLILLPDAIAENVETQKLKKRSLNLAGFF
jgi:homoserine dehydrogenase